MDEEGNVPEMSGSATAMRRPARGKDLPAFTRVLRRYEPVIVVICAAVLIAVFGPPAGR